MAKRTIGVLTFFALVLTHACTQQTSDNPIQAVANVKQLHDAMINPASDVIFKVSEEVPANDQEWIHVRNSAVILAESGNLLMVGDRVKDTGAWVELSRALVAGGTEALKAAESRNTEALLAAGNRIVDVCMSCHQPYRDGGRTMGK